MVAAAYLNFDLCVDDHGEQSNRSSSGLMVENAFSLRPDSSQNRGMLNFPSPIFLDLL